MKDRLKDHLEGWQFCENCGIKLYQQKNPTISNVKSLDLWSSRTEQIRTCRGKAPPSCLCKTVLLLKSPTGAFVASQTQTFFSAIGGQSVLKSDGLGAIFVLWFLYRRCIFLSVHSRIWPSMDSSRWLSDE